MKLIKKENGDYHLLSNNEIKSLQEFNITKEDCDILTLGYSVEKMGLQNFKDNDDGFTSFQDRIEGFVAGFETHQELVKDKLFTLQNLFDYSQLICEKLPKLKQLQTSQADDYGRNLDVILKIQDEFTQSLLPKTEWDIEIIDNKIKLL